MLFHWDCSVRQGWSTCTCAWLLPDQPLVGGGCPSAQRVNAVSYQVPTVRFVHSQGFSLPMSPCQNLGSTHNLEAMSALSDYACTLGPFSPLSRLVVVPQLVRPVQLVGCHHFKLSNNHSKMSHQGLIAMVPDMVLYMPLDDCQCPLM